MNNPKFGYAFAALLALGSLIINRLEAQQGAVATVPIRFWGKSTSSAYRSDLTVYGTFEPSSPTANDGYSSAYGFDGNSEPFYTAAAMAHVLPGKTYTLNFQSDNLYDGWGTATVAPPPGYRVMMNGACGNSTSLYLYAPVTFCLVPTNEAPPGAAGFASTISPAGIDWRLSLGSLLNGDPAGTLDLVDSGAGSDWSALYSPAGLSYESASSEVHVYYRYNMIRQISATQMVVDIVALNGTSGYRGSAPTNITAYEIRCYNPAQIAGSSVGVYNLSGCPFVVYRIQQGGAANSLQLTEETRNISDLNATGVPIAHSRSMTLQRTGTWPNVQWTKSDWTLDGQAPLVGASVQGSGSAQSRSEAIAMTAPGGATALNLARNYNVLACGEVLSSETVGSSSAKTVNLNYFSDPSQSGNFGYLESAAETGGCWVAYDYYPSNNPATGPSGQVKYCYKPYVNQPSSIAHNAGLGEVTYHEYGPDPFGLNTRPTLIRTSVNGTVVAQSTISYNGTDDMVDPDTGVAVWCQLATRNDYADSSHSITTKTWFFPEDMPTTFLRGRPFLVLRPDGSEEGTFYERGSWDGQTFTPNNTTSGSRITVVTGTSNVSAGAPWDTALLPESGAGTILPFGSAMPNGLRYAAFSLVNGISTAKITIRDSRALVVRTAFYVWSGSYSGGGLGSGWSGGWQLVSYVNYTYNDAGLLTGSISSNGTTTVAAYDGLLKTSETNESGVATNYSYDAAARVLTSTRVGAGAVPSVATHFVYDAMSNILEQHIGWGQSEQLISTRQFDDAGRITSEASPGLGATTHAYDVGNRIHTVTRPDGGTTVDTAYPDGRAASRTGSSVVAQFMSYGVESDGRTYVQTNAGSANSPRWQKSWKDWVGRDIKSDRPGYPGQPDAIEQKIYDNVDGHTSTGHLAQSSKTGYASTYYTYDVLGRLWQTGLDVDGSGSLVLASNARVAETDSSFEFFGGAWWANTDTVTYPFANSATPKTISTIRQRLSGFASGQIAEKVAVDAEGDVTDESTALNSATATITVTTTSSGLASPALQTILDGISVSTVTHDGITTTMGYDGLLRKSAVTDSRGNTTTTAYVSGSTLVQSVTDATGASVATYGYDSMGRRILQMDAGGHSTRSAYDYCDRLAQQWGDAATPLSCGYDSTYGDRLSMSTYRGGSGWNGATWPSSPGVADTTTWTYDGATGLQTAKTDAVGQTVGQTYNTRGQTATRTLARGVVTTYTYDGNTGELLSQTYSDGTPSVSYTYNREGKMNMVSDGTGNRTLAYDSSMPWRFKSESLDVFYGNRVVTRLYSETDVVGRVRGFQVGSSVGSNSDIEQTYAFTANGRFSSVTTDRNYNAASRTFTYGYLANSALVSSLSTSDSSFAVNRTFETQRDFLLSTEADWGGTNETRYDYTTNALGQRATLLQSGQAFAGYGNSTFRTFAYDGKGQLTAAPQYLGSSTSDISNPLSGRQNVYAYDTIGNRQSDGTGISSQQDAYATNALNQYPAAQIGQTAKNFTYDTDGNLTDDYAWSYAWDAENRLVSMETDSFALSMGATHMLVQFRYDYLGRRVQKRVINVSNGNQEVSSRRYLYDGWNLVAEYAAPGGAGIGSLVRSYTWGLDIARSLTDAGGVGALVQIADHGSGKTYLPTYDGNGNIISLVNGDLGALAAIYEYDPYGQPLRTQANDLTVADQPFRFSTKFYDAETGLAYYGHRYYSQGLGRFVNRDPIEESGGLNLYGFVLNNPINKWDDLGFTPSGWVGGMMGASPQTNLGLLNGAYSSAIASGLSPSDASTLVATAGQNSAFQTQVDDAAQGALFGLGLTAIPATAAITPGLIGTASSLASSFAGLGAAGQAVAASIIASEAFQSVLTYGISLYLGAALTHPDFGERYPPEVIIEDLEAISEKVKLSAEQAKAVADAIEALKKLAEAIAERQKQTPPPAAPPPPPDYANNGSGGAGGGGGSDPTSSGNAGGTITVAPPHNPPPGTVTIGPVIPVAGGGGSYIFINMN